MSGNPTTLQLRYLQTLLEIGADQNSTVVFPLPIDLLRPLMEVAEKQGLLPPGEGQARLSERWQREPEKSTVER
jgi:hypothetical protein